MNIYILLHCKYAIYFLDLRLILLINMIIRLANIVNIFRSLLCSMNSLIIYIVYSGMRLVFPIAMHTIEIIKQYNTCAFYIHKSKKEEKK